MTTSKNQSEAATLTTAVFTAIEASQKLTDALRDIAKIVSTEPQSKPEETTTESSSLSTLVLPKRKPGRPKKTLSATSTSSTVDTVSQETTLSETKKPSSSSTDSSGVKKRGASPETLAKARATLAAKRLRTDREKNPPLAVPAKGWPFPTSTKHNSDGTEKRKEDEKSSST